MTVTATLSLDHLRRYATARTLFKPSNLADAIDRFGFVQADPIRAPARAQDLILRHRVKGYRAGDLERDYPQLPIEEDFFVNYGFLPREHARLMHPRQARRHWDSERWARARDIQTFVNERGVAHPRDVQAAFDHGRAVNAWGGTSNAVTELMEGMHYRGLLRVARREGGQRLYAAVKHQASEQPLEVVASALIDIVVAKYAPLPAKTLGQLCSHLRWGIPQAYDNGILDAAKKQARHRLANAVVDGQSWYWPAAEDPLDSRWEVDDRVRLLAPFDPIVWDRLRFETFWHWPYRFEAYTPAPKRLLGYYALPILWRDRVVGWANVRVHQGRLAPEVGFFGPRLQDPVFVRAMDEEFHDLSVFLGLEDA